MALGVPAEIKCLFFSEFDPIAGPKISSQVLNLKILHDVYNFEHEPPVD